MQSYLKPARRMSTNVTSPRLSFASTSWIYSAGLVCRVRRNLRFQLQSSGHRDSAAPTKLSEIVFEANTQPNEADRLHRPASCNGTGPGRNPPCPVIKAIQPEDKFATRRARIPTWHGVHCGEVCPIAV